MWQASRLGRRFLTQPAGHTPPGRLREGGSGHGSGWRCIFDACRRCQRENTTCAPYLSAVPQSLPSISNTLIGEMRENKTDILHGDTFHCSSVLLMIMCTFSVLCVCVFNCCCFLFFGLFLKTVFRFLCLAVTYNEQQLIGTWRFSLCQFCCCCCFHSCIGSRNWGHDVQCWQAHIG